MGYTREQRAENARKKAEKEAQESIANVEKEAQKTTSNKGKSSKTQVVAKNKLKLDDGVLLSVRNNVFGRLIYINHKTGDETQWMEYGDVQPLSVGDLRAMKAKQPDFFKENWISIVGIESADGDYADIDMSEIYDSLMISQYYDTEFTDNLEDVFSWNVEMIREKLPRMTSSMKTSVIIMANELIESGKLDSIAKIKAIQDALNCTLVTKE